jgi:hypothetical protein
VTRAWSELGRVHARLGELVRGLPAVEVEDSHGHRSFTLKGKRIAWQLVDHHGDDRLALWVKAPAGEQQALVGSDPRRYFVPPYLGPSGWVGAQVDDASDPDWEQVGELLEQAWRMTAGKRAVTSFDAGRAEPGTTGRTRGR